MIADNDSDWLSENSEGLEQAVRRSRAAWKKFKSYGENSFQNAVPYKVGKWAYTTRSGDLKLLWLWGYGTAHEHFTLLSITSSRGKMIWWWAEPGWGEARGSFKDIIASTKSPKDLVGASWRRNQSAAEKRGKEKEFYDYLKKK